jgi:phenylacetate-CoA ligase
MGLYKRLVRDLLYPLSLWRSGELATLRYQQEFETSQFLPPEELRALQLERFRRLLDHAYWNCPFYRQRLDRLGLVPGDVKALDDIRYLPILEKRDIQEHRDELVARGWPVHELILNRTGGSTGTPLSFFMCRDRKCSRAAATARHNRWAGWEVGDKVAYLWGAPRDVAQGWRARLRSRFLERSLFLDAGHVTEARLQAFHASLQRFRPRILLAYAQAAVLFARYLRSHGLTAYQPHALVTSAEVLESDQRQLLEGIFGCPVFNRYGCRETSIVASECPAHDGLHIMAEGIHVEVVQGQGPAQPGEPGSILLTDLLNYSMPLIRYRVGDVGTWQAGLCRCGRGLPRLSHVAGRVTDFLVGADGRLVSGPFLSLYLVGRRPSLGQVQIRQDRAGEAHYRIRPPHGKLSDDDLRYLTEGTRNYLGAGARVSWEVVDELPSEPSGKFLFCRSAVTADFLDHPRASAEACR